MSQTFGRFIPLLLVLACSVQVSANSSVPVSDLTNDIGTESLAISQPAKAVVGKRGKGQCQCQYTNVVYCWRVAR